MKKKISFNESTTHIQNYIKEMKREKKNNNKIRIAIDACLFQPIDGTRKYCQFWDKMMVHKLFSITV